MSAQFKKPKNVRYVDMAIEVDRLIAIEDRELTNDEKNLIFEYLYHLAKMLARMKNFFNKEEYYENFALFLASSIYLRLFSPKIDQIDEKTGEPKLTPIKSCLNYMKVVLNPRRIEFEQKNYSQIYSKPVSEEEKVEYATAYTFSDMLSESTEARENVEFNICLGDVCKTARAFLKRIPYKYKSAEWTNIYLSCLLTLLNIITLPNHREEFFAEKGMTMYDKDYLLFNYFKKVGPDFVILYHLDNNMHDYIWILTQQIKKYIAKDLSLKTHEYMQPTSVLNCLALSEINMDYNSQGDE